MFKNNRSIIRAPPRRRLARRLAGASDDQLRVVAEAQPGEFVGTKRLEEEAGGAYTWRNILTGWFRSPATPVS